MLWQDEQSMTNESPNIRAFVSLHLWEMSDWRASVCFRASFLPSSAWSNNVMGHGEVKASEECFCQSGQSMWEIHQGPAAESWLCYGMFLCTDWTAWCFLVLLPPRIYQIHMPDNLEERIQMFYRRATKFPFYFLLKIYISLSDRKN